MTAGELFLESLSSGVITQSEIDWLLTQQGRFSRTEQAAMLRLGRLLDQGQIQLGCRSPQVLLYGSDPAIGMGKSNSQAKSISASCPAIRSCTST